MLTREVPERVLFMTGEAGIGKSTLVRQLMADLASDATPPIIALAECSTPVAGTGVGHVEALKPFADIMAGLVEAGAATGEKKKGFKLDIGKFFVDTAPSWLGLIPIVGGPIFHALSIVGSGYDQVYLHNKLKSQGASAASSQDQVFRQYINFISKLSEELPVLVILDDFHWADTSSTNLLFASARDLAACKVVFLVVYREDDIKRSANQEEHPILHVRNEIERYSMSRVIDVPPADQADLRALIKEAFPDYAPNEALEQWLLRITDGNLLFATQFLSTLEHDRYLEPRSAVLLKELSTVPVPSSATAVVVEHIRRLHPDDKEHLRYASVEGETITAHMVSRFLDMPMIKMLQRLRVLEEQHHILRSLGKVSLYAKETTAYQFVHFLVHKTLYEDLGEEERGILHGIAADVLEEELAYAEEAHHNVHTVAARLAAHATIAERYQVAAEALLKGAKWVWRSFAADEALYLLSQCQAVTQQKKASNKILAVSLSATLLEAEIYQHRARYSEASSCYKRAHILASELADSSLSIGLFIGLSNLKWVTGDYANAEDDARRALELATEANDKNGQVRALRLIGNTFYRRGDFDQSLEFYQKSFDTALLISDESGRASALANMGNVYKERGNIDKALTHHKEALAVRRVMNDTAGICRELVNLGLDLHSNHMYDIAIESFQEALKIAKSSGALRQETNILNCMGITRLSQGFYDEALEYAHQSLAIAERTGDRNGVLFSLGTIGNVYMESGQLTDAIDFFTRCAEMADAMNNRLVTAKARHSIAFVHVMQNNPSAALPLFEQTKLMFAEIGALHLQLEAAFALACCTVKLEAIESNSQVAIKSTTLQEKTRALMSENSFSEATYANVKSTRAEIFNSLGISVEA